MTPKWVTAKAVRCRTSVKMAAAKKQWHRITRHLLNRETQRAMVRPKWTMANGRPTVASRGGTIQMYARCFNGQVSFTMDL
jgi:hypothetical protein